MNIIQSLKDAFSSPKGLAVTGLFATVAGGAGMAHGDLKISPQIAATGITALVAAFKTQNDQQRPQLRPVHIDEVHIHNTNDRS